MKTRTRLLKRSFGPPGVDKSQPRRRQRPRPMLEQLENRITPRLITLASFNNINGAGPLASLIMDSSGNLYGTTEVGGASGVGTVFEVVAGSGSITTLASFNSFNGAYPESGLVEDSSGNLFGTTYRGGAFGYGTVFEVVAGSGSITTLASFNNSTGYGPKAGLAISFVYLADGMNDPKPDCVSSSGESFVCAFNELRTELVSTLYFYLGNYEDAQDAAQEAFLKCWRFRDTLGDVRNMRAWIFRVGLNSAKDLHRNAYRKRVRPLSYAGVPLEPEVASPERTAQDREAKARLRQALMDLRPDEKEVFLLRQNAALTYEEIAKLRHTPVGTVKTQMRAAITKLRRVLQEA